MCPTLQYNSSELSSSMSLFVHCTENPIYVFPEKEQQSFISGNT
jgi:hypothetical protein